MRYIGLDVGTRTIGVAVSDPLGFTAQGITTIRRKSLDHDFIELEAIFKEYVVKEVIVGLPKNMNGSIGPQAELSMEFGRQLEEKFNLKVIYWDERLTTMAANRIMLEADFSRKKRKSLVDKIAATYILQGYLDKIYSAK
ncbi:MAG TPA: Holliday junction resolvase RuvX [Clostridiaceae bacterium]|nr:Holliday junction resolvase RuvX [Clostridiaceae bacterium]